MPAPFSQTILVLCGNDNTWNAIRESLAKRVPGSEISRVFETDRLAPTAAEKRPTFIVIDWNAYSPGDVATALQRMRATPATANTPIVFMLTCPIDVQALAMAAEYSVRNIIYFSDLQNSLATASAAILEELSRPDSLQTLISRVSKAHAMNALGELDMSVLDLYAMFPKETFAQIEYANYCIRYGDWEKAKKIVDPLLVTERKNPRVLNAKVRILLKEKRYEEAGRLIGQAQFMSPNNAARLALLGDVFVAKGQKKEAREKYQSALAIVENCRDAKRSLAQLDITEGMVADALVVLRDSSTEEEMGSFFNDVGIIAVHEGRNAEAHTLYGAALSVLQKNKLRARIHFNIGLAYYKADNVSEATKEFVLAQNDDPQFERAQMAVSWFSPSDGSEPHTIWMPTDSPNEESLWNSEDGKIPLDSSKRAEVSKDELSPLAQFGANIGQKKKKE